MLVYSWIMFIFVFYLVQIVVVRFGIFQEGYKIIDVYDVNFVIKMVVVM